MVEGSPVVDFAKGKETQGRTHKQARNTRTDQWLFFLLPSSEDKIESKTVTPCRAVLHFPDQQVVFEL